MIRITTYGADRTQDRVVCYRVAADVETQVTVDDNGWLWVTKVRQLPGNMLSKEHVACHRTWDHYVVEDEAS